MAVRAASGTTGRPGTGGPVAVIGMAGRFPGAPGVDALWSALSAGTEAVRRFSVAELRAAGVAEDLLADPDYLPFAADLAGVEDFDAAFFGVTPAEARLVDPQQRIFLECVWAALEDAGTPPATHGARTGVFGGASLSSYLLHHVLRSAEYRDEAFTYPVLLGNDKDFLATRVCYALDLRGPGVTVQSACSSSLVAVDSGCAALRSGRCDLAVAGGVSVFTPQTVGYRYRPGGTFSRDGHCRPFDAAASGMVRGSGCGVVVLKRLADALADRDRVYAVVAGTAVNNDGSAKAGYSAPSAAGQEEVIRACLAAAGLPAREIGYVEAHGTGTYLGDPIEVAALHAAYQADGDPPGACALGSVKANIGHLDAAAGVTGLIKAALVLRHQAVPPQINYERPNPELRLEETPFTVHRELTRPTAPIRAAAVSALGIGGTNAHAVLTAPPDRPDRPPAPPGPYLLRLSAPDPERLRQTAGDLLDHLEHHPRTRLDDLARTLAHGRTPLEHRTAVAVDSVRQAKDALRRIRDGRGGDDPAHDPERVGDLRHAATVRLPGTPLRRERHWIEPEPAPSAVPAPRAAADRPDDPLAAVVRVFRDLLGVGTVGPDDDFFALGGDSLHAIGVVDALNGRLGARLTLEEFTRLRTPRAVAGASGAAPADDALVLVKGDPADRGGTAAFLIHPAGGSIAFAQALAGHSAAPGTLYGIRYPAELTDSLTTIPRMAGHYARLIRRARPHGPYRVGGYSLGGLVALEVARLLAEAGEPVDPVLLWDTPPPGTGASGLSDEEFLAAFPGLLRLMFDLPGADEPVGGVRYRTVGEAIDAVRAPHWTPATVRELRTMYRVWRVCDRAMATHRPPRYDGAVHLFTARQPLPPALSAALREPGAVSVERWRRHLGGDLRVTAVPGHHFSMFDPGHLPGLAAAYDAALAAPAEDPGGAGHPGSAGRPGPAVPPPGPAASRPVALLFPGQGTQYAGMGRDLLARYPEAVAEADEVLGYPIAQVCAGDPDRPLRDTAFSQPAVYVVGALALRDHLERTGEEPAVVLGHSLGEYNALHAAGVFGFAEGLRLVARRGALMARIEGGGMIAVTGLAQEEALRVVADAPSATGGGPAPVDLAASNAPRNLTLSGPLEELDALTPVLLEHGARSVRRLNVSGPFHSRLMRPAAVRFREVADAAAPHLRPPRVPVVANTTARPHVPGLVADELVAQIDHPVLWSTSVERVIADHDPRFEEIGGRRVLLPMVAALRASASGSAV